MTSYQPPIDTTAIFNSQSFLANNYNGESDPNKLDFPNAQGVPTMPSVNVSDGINSSLITPTGITNSGAYSFDTTSPNPIVTTNASGNTLIASKSSYVLGIDNTILGVNAVNGVGSSDMVNNTCIGRNAGLLLLAAGANQASSNTFVGRGAGSAINTGSLNVCIGLNAGAGTSSGNTNTFIGSNTSSSVNVGSSTVIGASAVATASNQVVLGTSSESVFIPSGNIYTPASNINISSNKTLTLGANNVAIGLAALQNANASTSGNNAIGYGALQNSKASNNTAIGFYALPTVTSGGNNTAIGNSAGGINGGVGITTGGNNTFLGANTNVASGGVAFTKSTAIGHEAIITASNQVVLGTSTESVVIPARKIIGLVTNAAASFAPTFPLSEIYNITPSLSGSAIVITLPAPVASNVGAVTTFRITGIGNANVSLTGSANIFPSTTTVGSSSHTIYTGGTSVLFSATSTTASITSTTLTLSGGTPPTLTVGTLITGTGVTAGTLVTAILSATTYTINKGQTATPTNYILPTTLTSHTFMLLSTPLVIGGLGWFQLGNV
jgi:hypothetical protein